MDCSTFAFDLHVLGTPPALILSQDQTLQLNSRRSGSTLRPARGAPRTEGTLWSLRAESRRNLLSSTQFSKSHPVFGGLDQNIETRPGCQPFIWPFYDGGYVRVGKGVATLSHDDDDMRHDDDSTTAARSHGTRCNAPGNREYYGPPGALSSRGSRRVNQPRSARGGPPPRRARSSRPARGPPPRPRRARRRRGAPPAGAGGAPPRRSTSRGRPAPRGGGA